MRRELEPIAALAGHFPELVRPFVPTIGLVRGYVPEGEVAASVRAQMRRTERRNVGHEGGHRKYALIKPGDRFGAYVVVRQLERDRSSNERVELVCDVGHTRIAFAHNVRTWPITKRCIDCPNASKNGSVKGEAATHRKHLMPAVGETYGEFTIAREAERDHTRNERWELRCKSGHVRFAYAFNLRKRRDLVCAVCVKERNDRVLAKFAVTHQASESSGR